MNINDLINASHQAQFDRGNQPWAATFKNSSSGAITPCNGVTGQAYPSELALLLTSSAQHGEPYFLSSQQIKDFGGTLSLEAEAILVTTMDDSGLKRAYPVFNAADVQGLEIDQLPAHQAALDNPLDYLTAGDYPAVLNSVLQKIDMADPNEAELARLYATSATAHIHGVEPDLATNLSGSDLEAGAFYRASAIASDALSRSMAESIDQVAPKVAARTL